MSSKYKSAGVNLEAGYESVRLMKKHVQKTFTKGVMSNIGSFGGMFDLSCFNYKEPVLISGTDGVGTKIILAKELGIYNTIGIDLVAMCVNDCLSQGAKPLFFLDYIATSKVDPQRIESIVSGICEGCCQALCSLIGGETAEMPDLYSEDDFDIAGFCVGCVEKSKLIDGSLVKSGDVLIGLPSSGVHSNGFSLVRKIIKDNSLDLNTPFMNSTLGKTLLTPTKIYVSEVLELLEKVKVNGIAHITGGGFIENVPRILKDGLKAVIDINSFPTHDIFKFLEEKGNIDHLEMYNIFNMGIGLVICVDKEDVSKVKEVIKDSYVIGEIKNGNGVTLI